MGRALANGGVYAKPVIIGSPTDFQHIESGSLPTPTSESSFNLLTLSGNDGTASFSVNVTAGTTNGVPTFSLASLPPCAGGDADMTRLLPPSPRSPGFASLASTLTLTSGTSGTSGASKHSEKSHKALLTLPPCSPPPSAALPPVPGSPRWPGVSSAAAATSETCIDSVASAEVGPGMTQVQGSSKAFGFLNSAPSAFRLAAVVPGMRSKGDADSMKTDFLQV
jgi:hypothetical protein